MSRHETRRWSVVRMSPDEVRQAYQDLHQCYVTENHPATTPAQHVAAAERREAINQRLLAAAQIHTRPGLDHHSTVPAVAAQVHHTGRHA